MSRQRYAEGDELVEIKGIRFSILKSVVAEHGSRYRVFLDGSGQAMVSVA